MKFGFQYEITAENFVSDKTTGATLTPIYQVSVFSRESAEELERVFNNKAPGFAYTRISNPTVSAFEKRINALEKGLGAVACSSGMAAVSMSLMNILRSGDEVIASSGLFGGTIDLFGDLKEFGITTRFVEHTTPKEIEPLINEKTRVIFAELIGNPGLEVVDISAVARLAHSRGVPLILDSTTATPYLERVHINAQRPSWCKRLLCAASVPRLGVCLKTSCLSADFPHNFVENS